MSAPLTRGQIVAAARAWIGTPYRHGASLRGVGCDCLGLVRGVWRELMGCEPETPPVYAPGLAGIDAGEPLAEGAARHFVPVAPDEAASGDLLLLRWRAHLPARHCAIIAAPGRIIHAHDGACVAEVALGAWGRRVAFAYRFPNLALGEER